MDHSGQRECIIFSPHQCKLDVLSRRNLIVGLYFIIALLLAANLFVVYGEIVLHRQYSFSRQFYFDRRLNFPFFFSVLLLLINTWLLYSISRNSAFSKTQKLFWNTLLVMFFLFTLDEAFYIHQHFKMSTFGRIASYDRKSWSHYLWVIPYFVIFGGLLTLLVRQSNAITSAIRIKLIFAGMVFLTGAVVMEFVGTYYAVMWPRVDIYILLIKTTEGVLQLIGSVMFVNIFLLVNEKSPN